MDSDKVCYVTALYDIGGRPVNELLDAFQPFAKSSMHICIFTDQTDLQSKIGRDGISIHIVPRDVLHIFKHEATVLPSGRNEQKDTLDFLRLMNAKPDFLMRASILHPEPATFVWMDFGILKISKNTERFVKRIQRSNEAVELTPNKIILPGCTGRISATQDCINQPIWRFCGGIAIVPRSLVRQFFELTFGYLETLRSKQTLTWEVNVWAAIESAHPDFFHWYSADHNDSIVDSPIRQSEKRVIFLSMIKNESRIIKRCIESALPIADAVCICDTGSTDTTVEVLTEYFSEFKVPTKIYSGPEHLWQNFGYNRSQSFLAVVDFCKQLGWDPEHTYALVLDADMQLKPQPSFSKSLLTSAGYKMIQKSHTLEYYNTRFMKIGHPWKCVGVTHEYWDGANTDTLTKDKIFIDDIGDGGCKDDKFERDVRLLEQGLIDSPNNPRYLFYLAQSYKDNKQIDKSIELYKRRIEAGGWYEEIWYSMYTLMKLYAEKKMPAEMELWGNKAYEFRKERAENILYLCRHFKDKRQHFKAWHYYTLGASIRKPDDLLFIEPECYEKGFDTERVILHDYVFPHKKQESLNHSITYYNKWNEYFAYMNIQWFVQKIPCAVRNLGFHTIGDFVPTSTCIVKQADQTYRLNVRYVNYRIQPNGSYLMMKDGKLSGDHHVRTDNYTCVMDSELNLISPLRQMVVKAEPKHDKHIKGLEDVRIFLDGTGQTRFFGTTMEYSYDGKIRQVCGNYNSSTGELTDLEQMIPHIGSDCEKNWIPYGEGSKKIIYSWHPFTIGHIGEDRKFAVDSTQQTPKLLSHMRGSSTLVQDGDYYYGITHSVIYNTPRKYYHMVVKIDAKTNRLVGYTDPFYFINNAIEYCLGFLKQGTKYIAIVSQNDCTPIMATFQDSDVYWRSV